MSQHDAWEREYRNPNLVSLGDEPQQDVKNFLRFLRKDRKVELRGLRILDLGSGTGKNANFLASLGNEVVGLEFSETALDLARKRAADEGLTVDYRLADIGEPYAWENASFDVVLDVMSSNSLSEAQRAVYLKEVHRVLKPGGYFFLRGLRKEGDKNTKMLLKLSPGPEHDTYLNKDMGLTERVFTEQDFRALYQPSFTIVELSPKTNYARFGDRRYKRNYWLATMQNKGRHHL